MSDNDKKYPVCPRCNGLIPNNEKPGAYMGALSRADNKTEVCSECGVEEALIDFANKTYRTGSPHDMSKWPLPSPRAAQARTVELLKRDS